MLESLIKQGRGYVSKIDHESLGGGGGGERDNWLFW